VVDLRSCFETFIDDVNYAESEIYGSIRGPASLESLIEENKPRIL